MRVILDECIPRLFKRALSDHFVTTVAAQGWAGLKNGRLLTRIDGAFDALVTMDRSMPAQQSVTGRSFGVVVLRAPSNRLIHLDPLGPQVLSALGAITPGQILLVPPS